ncbi:hypothetical protein KSF_057760 [Reticulibacter mediterranei]|uniref:Uncharacterized protein n=1 Tax=Reticulibacter mediterranei TaxID=2778369 RepID=A0A8J3INM4_9CHLR|nr:hypothetical protein KSF_057760 [Reticulibacter mediterranei]
MIDKHRGISFTGGLRGASTLYTPGLYETLQHIPNGVGPEMLRAGMIYAKNLLKTRYSHQLY